MLCVRLWLVRNRRWGITIDQLCIYNLSVNRSKSRELLVQMARSAIKTPPKQTGSSCRWKSEQRPVNVTLIFDGAHTSLGCPFPILFPSPAATAIEIIYLWSSLTPTSCDTDNARLSSFFYYIHPLIILPPHAHLCFAHLQPPRYFNLFDNISLE